MLVWKAVPLFKGNTSILWYTTGVQGNGSCQYASLGPITFWKAVPLFKVNVSVLWYTTGVHGNGFCSVS